MAAVKTDINTLFSWQPPETAPKDGTLILADMGWPWPCLACWDEYDEKWVYTNRLIDGTEGAQHPYFETEYGRNDELKRWTAVLEPQK